MQKNILFGKKKTRAIGYVESLIAIAVAGTLMVVIGLLTTRILKATIENEMDDTATQQMVLYMDIIRAIRDNGWGTEDGQPPILDSYDICYTEEDAYYLCDPGLESENLFDEGEKIFNRVVTVDIDGDDGLIEFKIELTCIEGKCRDLEYAETEVFKIEETQDIISVDVPACGNAVIDAGEECDDGNTTDGDGCSSVCLLPRCGDGFVDPNEECDDGNTTDGDGCSSSCLTQVCGNKKKEQGEDCDDGNKSNTDECSTYCTRIFPYAVYVDPRSWLWSKMSGFTLGSGESSCVVFRVKGGNNGKGGEVIPYYSWQPNLLYINYKISTTRPPSACMQTILSTRTECSKRFGGSKSIPFLADIHTNGYQTTLSGPGDLWFINKDTEYYADNVGYQMVWAYKFKCTN